MITSAHNEQLKTIRKLQDKRWREKLDLFAAEGEDLVDAASAAGLEPEILLRAGEDVEPELLAEVSTLGSGTRVIGVYRRRWSAPGGGLSVYLHGVHDPGNVGAVIRAMFIARPPRTRWRVRPPPPPHRRSCQAAPT